ncbi:protein eva-1 homolog C isoform X2 [Denticeps clupeoides]|uniref:SUEL-type lectin domain-containing protein n=1 Tax=Denticeps clupeoides TaxID=299321 RepID=A0AAY4C9P1_9TELE|nr:protein eva-1 homolog C-like isoform X2 [Denticeps clupeoides]
MYNGSIDTVPRPVVNGQCSADRQLPPASVNTSPEHLCGYGTMLPPRSFGTFLCPASFLFLLLLLAMTTHRAQAAPDFTVYLYKVLRNHTAHACNGDTLTVKCPSKTTVSILSVFYGRRIPSQYLCPSTNLNMTGDENTECMSSTAIQKVISECQDRRTCQLPVISAVFGQDPCPETTKYVIVSYKCRPEHHRTKMVCENERMRLSCRNDTVLAIYSAMFGHQIHWSHECPQEIDVKTDMECLSPTALRRVSRRCHGRTNCSLLADVLSFGDPCFPGTRMHLRVSYTCVPRYLLEDAGLGNTDPFLISDYTHGLPETVALYFVSGICAGLVFLLCLFGLKSTLVRDAKDLFSELSDELKAARRKRLASDFDDDSDIISDTSFHRLPNAYRVADMFGPEMIMTVEMVERQQDTEKEVPDGDIWPRGDSSPYAINNVKTSSA